MRNARVEALAAHLAKASLAEQRLREEPGKVFETEAALVEHLGLACTTSTDPNNAKFWAPVAAHLESLAAGEEDQLEQHPDVVASLDVARSYDLRRIESAVRACRDENRGILAAAILCGAVPAYLKPYVPPAFYVEFVRGPGDDVTEADLALLWRDGVRFGRYNPPDAPVQAICGPCPRDVGPVYTYAELREFRALGVGRRRRFGWCRRWCRRSPGRRRLFRSSSRRRRRSSGAGDSISTTGRLLRSGPARTIRRRCWRTTACTGTRCLRALSYCCWPSLEHGCCHVRRRRRDSASVWRATPGRSTSSRGRR